MMIHKANEIRKKKAMENRWELYETINKNQGKTIYRLAKLMNWTTGKVGYYIKKLLKEGILKCSTEIINSRVNKKYFSKDWKEMINWDKMSVKPKE